MEEIERNLKILEAQVMDKQAATIRAGTQGVWSLADWEDGKRQFKVVVDDNMGRAVDLLNLFRSDVCAQDKRRICERRTGCLSPCKAVPYEEYCSAQPAEGCPAPCIAERRFYVGPKRCIYKPGKVATAAPGPGAPIPPPPSICSYPQERIALLAKYRPPMAGPTMGPSCPLVRKL